MEDKLKKLMSLKKKSREMSPVEKSAKSDVLKKLMGEMSGMMGERLKGIKKVTVAADSKPGLEEGLEKAKEMLTGDEDMSPMEASEEGEMEDEEHELAEEDESEDDIDAQIKALMLKKEMRKKGPQV